MQYTVLIISVLSVICLAVFANPLEPKNVDGATGCGGTGTLIAMYSTNCTVSPCHYEINTTYSYSLSFLAGETSSNSLWQLWFYTPNGGVRLLREYVVDTVISTGSPYAFGVDNVTLPNNYQGISGEVAIMITNQENGSRLICGEFPYLVKAES